MATRSDKPRVLVSACLLGEPVRYDGGHKRHAWLVEELLPRIEAVAVCPEVGIGLGVPRPPIQLVQTDAGIRALGVEDPTLDVTERLVGFAVRQAHAWLCGALLKARSPSCGVATTPLFDPEGQAIDTTSGLFAAELQAALPGLPVIDEDALEDRIRRERWLEAIFERQRFLADPDRPVRLASAPDLIRLQPMRDALALAGVPYRVRNEYLGGVLGELPAQEIWPELWVTAGDLDRARAALARLETPAGHGEAWTCPRCGERNGPAFEVCWRCTTPRPD